jgi:hypothetical protein
MILVLHKNTFIKKTNKFVYIKHSDIFLIIMIAINLFIKNLFQK